MSHQVSTPPPDGGGGSFAASNVRLALTWTPPHDMPPAVERRRFDRADSIRAQTEAQIAAILNRPYEAQDED